MSYQPTPLSERSVQLRNLLFIYPFLLVILENILALEQSTRLARWGRRKGLAHEKYIRSVGMEWMGTAASPAGASKPTEKSFGRRPIGFPIIFAIYFAIRLFVFPSVVNF